MLQTYRIRRVLRKIYSCIGYGIVPINAATSFSFAFGKVLASQNISTVLDVGANEGQYGLWLREIGYRGQIISFEPGFEANGRLQEVAKTDARWKALNPLALGEHEGQVELLVTRNSQCSSILKPAIGLPSKDYGVVRSELVRMTTVKHILAELDVAVKTVCLKMDVQGAEKSVLEGCADLLGLIPVIQLEASTIPIYEGESAISDIIDYMSKCGYQIATMNRMLVDQRTGCMRQCDLVFVC